MDRKSIHDDIDMFPSPELTLHVEDGPTRVGYDHYFLGIADGEVVGVMLNSRIPKRAFSWIILTTSCLPASS